MEKESRPPAWLALLAPLPDGVAVERKPVASAEQIAQGTDGPIAGWQSISVNLWAPEGSRNVLVTIDATGKILSAGDHVLFIKPSDRDGIKVTIYDHESVGGRYADDGSFQGTRWQTRTEQVVDADDDGETTSTPSAPSESDIAALNQIVADVVKRA
jgi:hypothetical protein